MSSSILNTINSNAEILKINNISTNGVEIGGGGGALSILNNSVTISGSIDSPLTVDTTDSQALVIRKNNNSGDIFTIDTLNGVIDVVSSSFNVSGTIQGIPSLLQGSFLNVSGNTFVDNDTATSGTASGVFFNYIGQPTLDSSNISVTTTDSSTLYIEGAPIAGTNQTILNSYALHVSSGISKFVGDVSLDAELIILNTTDATSATVGGTLTTAGGVGIAKKLFVGSDINVQGTATFGGVNNISGVINSANTTASTSPETGSVLLDGGIGISNTTDAISSVNGGTFTTAGGAAFGKSVYVGGVTRITDTTTSTSGTTGALTVSGGVGIAENLNVNGDTSTISLSSEKIAVNGDTSTIESVLFETGYVNTQLSANKDILKFSTFKAPEYDLNSFTANATATVFIEGSPSDPNDFLPITQNYSLYVQGDSILGNLRTTGNLIVLGVSNFIQVVSFISDVNIQGLSRVNNVTDSTSTITGALVVSGGVGIAKNLNVGGNLNVTGTLTGIAHDNLNGLLDDDHTQYALLAGRTGGQILTGGNASGNDLILRSTTNATKGNVVIDETTTSTSATTGALVVSGGVGIGGKLFLGNTLECRSSTNGSADPIANFVNSNGNARMSIIDENTSQSLPATITNKISFFGLGIRAESGDIKLFRGTGNTPQFRVLLDSISIPLTTASTSTTTGALVVSGGAGIAENLNVGGDIFVSGGSGAPTTTTRSNGTRIVLFNGLSATEVDSAIGISASTQWYSVNSAAHFHRFYHGTSNTVTMTGSSLEVNHTTASTSTTTGALTVAGGAGISGALNVGEINTTNGLVMNYTRITGTDLKQGVIEKRYSLTSTSNFANEQLLTTEFLNKTPLLVEVRSSITVSESFLAAVSSFKGFLYISVPGLYTFGTNSDDCSDIFVDGKLVADWYGIHAANATITQPGGNQRTINLGIGYHVVITRLGQGGEGVILYTLWKAPGDSAFSLIPSNVLYYDPKDLISSNVGDRILVNDVSIMRTTTSTNTTTGALIVSGGVGISGTLNAGDNSSFNTGRLRLVSFDGANYIQSGSTGFSTSSAQLRFGPTYSSAIWTSVDQNQLVVNQTTASTSTTTGALTVAGGAGISGALNVGGNLNLGAVSSAGNSRLTVNPLVVDRGTFDHSEAPLTLTQPIATSNTVLNDPKAVLHLTRQGTTGEAFGARATFALSRYENDGGSNSRTRMDILMSHVSYDSVPVMTMRSSGAVGIGTTTPGYALDVVGDIYASGDIIAFSDERLKKDIQTVPNALDTVSKMRGVYYTHKTSGERGVGVIAQEMETVLPEVVKQKAEYRGVAYGNIVGILIEAVKELSEKIRVLENMR